MRKLTDGQRKAYELQLAAKIRRDDAVGGKIPKQARQIEPDAEYGVEVMNSTDPPRRSRWVAVETEDGWEQYFEEEFPGQDEGWVEIPAEMV